MGSDLVGLEREERPSIATTNISGYGYYFRQGNLGDEQCDLGSPWVDSDHGSAWNTIVVPLDPKFFQSPCFSSHILLDHCVRHSSTRLHLDLVGPNAMALESPSGWLLGLVRVVRVDWCELLKPLSKAAKGPPPGQLDRETPTAACNMIFSTFHFPYLRRSAGQERLVSVHPALILVIKRVHITGGWLGQESMQHCTGIRAAPDPRSTRDGHVVSFTAVKSRSNHIPIDSATMSEDQDSDSTTTEYQFVFGTDQPGARSHAMRQFWRRRHQALQSSPQTTRPQLRTLLPKDYSSESRGYQQDASQGQTRDPPEGEGQQGSAYAKSPASDVDHGHQSSIIQGPGPKFPIDLSAKDQEIFSSWLDLHASFGPGLSQSTGFDPVRDLWLPLDLSNSASFCALMAHAAAHVAHRQGQTKSIESEKFRTLAVGIIAKWLADERRSTQDDTITAIARLLMFEKYWAIDDQWRAHKNGLVSVINARGGVENFRSSWRLHMVLFLAFSLAEPSRNSSPAHVWEITEYFVPATVHPAIELRLHQVNPKASQGLIAYPDIHETIIFLASSSNLTANASPHVQDHTLLCLFILAVIFQESLYSSSPELGRSFSAKLPVLNEALSKSKSIWKRSSQELYEFLMEDHFNLLLSPSARSFITKVAQNLVYLNESAQAAVAKCLLNKLLWQSQDVKADSHLQSDGTR
ncbi:hypothetical protein BO85DRAFT_501041 [Aspergillus piperis CBS 112811]|uniref:Transcription factor domain-containing protein n=1 Tax=Aspergillus piperis CBS 112811 TaxID=1448313 RepID=A0A8G1VR90_9EURO|nr:hypothetical protein BO85DRAFT_501041 [Aspergillus piperis CBS 112811]RAH61655.1 hypothetical protein BO85DRAFT_501041 [Aspergillus piperis CBS 112811]